MIHLFFWGWFPIHDLKTQVNHSNFNIKVTSIAVGELSEQFLHIRPFFVTYSQFCIFVKEFKQMVPLKLETYFILLNHWSSASLKRYTEHDMPKMTQKINAVNKGKFFTRFILL